MSGRRRRLRAVSLAMIFASLIGLIVCSFMHVHPIDNIVMCIVMMFGFLIYPSRGMFDDSERRPRSVDDNAQDYDAKRAEIRERAAEMRSEEQRKDDNKDDAK